MSEHQHPNNDGIIMTWWRRLSPLPAGAWLFSLALGRIAPYSGTIGGRVEQLRPGFARVRLRDRRRVRNHLRSIHAIALINLGEIATGLAVLSTISGDMRGIVTRIEADYLKKARGELIAEAEFSLPAELDENTACQVEATLRDASGDAVTRVRASWLIGYKTS
jgi:acyl-coenzyme A thioesterase PaaI-like protein